MIIFVSRKIVTVILYILENTADTIKWTRYQTAISQRNWCRI